MHVTKGHRGYRRSLGVNDFSFVGDDYRISRTRQTTFDQALRGLKIRVEALPWSDNAIVASQLTICD